MNEPLLWFAFALAIGFVISAIVSNTFGAITKSATPFQLQVNSDVERLGMIGLLLLAGPHLLFHAANESRLRGEWPTVYVWASYGLGLMWSFILGFAVLSIFSV